MLSDTKMKLASPTAPYERMDSVGVALETVPYIEFARLSLLIRNI